MNSMMWLQVSVPPECGFNRLNLLGDTNSLEYGHFATGHGSIPGTGGA